MTVNAYPAGTLNIATVKQTIYNWIEARVDGLLSGVCIVWRQQSEPLPKRPCITMKIISGPTRVGYSDGALYVGGQSGTAWNYCGHRELVVSIQVFGSSKVRMPNAYQLAIDLNSSLSVPSALQLLRSGGIAMLKQGDIQNLTALEETEWEERMQFDMTLGLVQNIIDDPGSIEHIGPITDIIGG